MELKYPSLNEFIKNNFDPNEVGTNAMEQSFDLIGSCINKFTMKMKYGLQQIVQKRNQ